MCEITEAQQIFLVFYGILYGAFFTLSDRWKPFAFENMREGRNRLVLSVVFLGLLPVVYFAWAFQRLPYLISGVFIEKQLSFPGLFLVMFFVTPVYGFYALWMGIVIGTQSKERFCFYKKDAWKRLLKQFSTAFEWKLSAPWSFVLGFFFTLVPALALCYTTYDILWQLMVIMVDIVLSLFKLLVTWLGC